MADVVVPPARRPGAWDGLGLGVLAGGLFVALQPCAVHGDALVLFGRSSLPAAVAATPLGAVWQWFGAQAAAASLPPHRVGLVLAAVATAVAIVATHATARCFGLSRARAALAGGFVAALPAVATATALLQPLVLVLPLAALATWLATQAGRRNGWPWAVAAAAVAALAHAATPVGALLWPLLLPWLLLAAAPGAGLPWRAFAAMAGAGAALVAWWTWGQPLRGMPTYEMVRSYDLGTLAPLVARDAGRSFLPLALVVPAAAFAATWHRHALVLLAAAGIGTLLGCHLTTTLGDDGSFLLPLAPAAALLAAGWLSPRLAVAALLAGLVLAGTKVALQLQWGPQRDFAAAIERVRGNRPFVLLLGPRRDEGYELARPLSGHVERLLPLVAAGSSRSATAVRDELLAAARGGRCLVVSDEAENALRDPFFRAAYPGAAALLHELDAAFTWRNVVELGFAGHELVPK